MLYLILVAYFSPFIRQRNVSCYLFSPSLLQLSKIFAENKSGIITAPQYFFCWRTTSYFVSALRELFWDYGFLDLPPKIPVLTWIMHLNLYFLNIQVYLKSSRCSSSTNMYKFMALCHLCKWDQLHKLVRFCTISLGRPKCF